MSGRIDPDLVEEWFALVSRWEQVEAELRSTTEQVHSEDQGAAEKKALAENELAQIKQRMDTLVSQAKLLKSLDTGNFLSGSLQLKRD